MEKRLLKFFALFKLDYLSSQQPILKGSSDEAEHMQTQMAKKGKQCFRKKQGKDLEAERNMTTTFKQLQAAVQENRTILFHSTWGKGTRNWKPQGDRMFLQKNTLSTS